MKNLIRKWLGISEANIKAAMPKPLYTLEFKKSCLLVSENFREEAKQESIKGPGYLQEYAQGEFLIIMDKGDGVVRMLDKHYLKSVVLDA